VLRARGRQFPVEVRYAPPKKDAPLADAVAQAVREALEAEPGSALVFLPGEREIREVAARLGETLETPVGPARVAPLFGRLSAEEQNRAVRPAPQGERKVVLATDIAETSLTIEGVRVVVDAGLSREPRFDAATGLSRLVTVAASKAAAEQRAGRAGRTEPGVAIRLWARAEEVQRPDYATPGLQQVDLLPLALELAGWGEAVAELDWLEPPPAHGMAAAQAILAELGALDAEGRITDHGRALLRLPTHPRLAHMLLRACERGLARWPASWRWWSRSREWPGRVHRWNWGSAWCRHGVRVAAPGSPGCGGWSRPWRGWTTAPAQQNPYWTRVWRWGCWLRWPGPNASRGHAAGRPGAS